MSKIDELDGVRGVGSKGNPQVQAYQENMRMEADKKMTLHRMAEKFGLDANVLVSSGVEPQHLKQMIQEISGSNGSTEFNGEKKEALYAKLGYNIDGLAVNVATHIGSAKGTDTGSGGSFGGSGRGDNLNAISLITSKAPENIFSFSPALNRIAKRLDNIGISMTDDMKKALQNLEDYEPASLKTLSQKIMTLDKAQIEKEMDLL